MSLRAVIVDDEPLALDLLESLLKDHGGVEVIARAHHSQAARIIIESEKPDLVFLDIQMPGGTGLELAQSLPKRDDRAIIFVTAYAQHALDAFRLDAANYLLKPIDEDGVADSLARAHRQLGTRDPGVNQPDGLPTLSDGERSLRVDPDALLALQAADDYVTLVDPSGATRLVRMTLAKAELALRDYGFVRIHRSTLINTSHLRELRPARRGEAIAVLSGGHEFKVSRSFAAGLKALWRAST